MIFLSPLQCSEPRFANTTIQTGACWHKPHSRLVGPKVNIRRCPQHLTLNHVAISTLGEYASDVFKFAQERLSLREG
jgi:hypothetical protein